jgi:hypothetical protein
MSTTTISVAPATSGSRSRPQARKKPNDDAGYFGPSQGANAGAGAKRQAGDKADGEPRPKRKRVDERNGVRRVERGVEGVVDGRDSLVSLSKGTQCDSFFFIIIVLQVRFTTMPPGAIYQYLTHFDLVPSVYPSPLSADDPPPPSSLEHQPREPVRPISPSPSTGLTPANRPRRGDSKEKSQGRRRTTRHMSEEGRFRCPVLADIEEAYRVLAGIAEAHFVSQVRREEVDILASFMCKVKKGGPGQPANSRRAVRY